MHCSQEVNIMLDKLRFGKERDITLMPHDEKQVCRQKLPSFQELLHKLLFCLC